MRLSTASSIAWRSAGDTTKENKLVPTSDHHYATTRRISDSSLTDTNITKTMSRSSMPTSLHRQSNKSSSHRSTNRKTAKSGSIRASIVAYTKANPNLTEARKQSLLEHLGGSRSYNSATMEQGRTQSLPNSVNDNNEPTAFSNVTRDELQQYMSDSDSEQEEKEEKEDWMNSTSTVGTDWMSSCNTLGDDKDWIHGVSDDQSVVLDVIQPSTLPLSISAVVDELRFGNEDEPNKAARCIQKFFRYAKEVLVWHKEEFQYWQAAKADVGRRRSEEMEDVRTYLEMEKQRAEVELHMEYNKEQDETGLDWDTYHQWTREQADLIAKEKEQGREMEQAIHALTHQNSRLTRTSQMKKYNTKCLTDQVSELEWEKNKWTNILLSLKGATCKAEKAVKAEQEKLEAEQQKIRELKRSIRDMAGQAQAQLEAWQSVAIEAEKALKADHGSIVSEKQNQENTQMRLGGPVTASTASDASNSHSTSSDRRMDKEEQTSSATLVPKLFSFANVVQLVVVDGDPREAAARCIQKFFRHTMLLFQYVQDEAMYWEAERQDIERRRQEELLEVQKQVEQEKKQIQLEILHEFSNDSQWCHDQTDTRMPLDFDAFLKETKGLKEMVKTGRQERDHLMGKVQCLTYENKQLDQAVHQQVDSNRGIEATVKLLEDKCNQNQDIAMGCKRAMTELKREIKRMDQRIADNNRCFGSKKGIYSKAALQKNAAHCILRFFRSSKVALQQYKEEVNYWKGERQDVERRRKEELKDVQMFIELEKQNIDMELQGEVRNCLGTADCRDSNQTICDWDATCAEIAVLRKKIQKEKKQQSELLGDIRFLEYKNKQLEQTNPAQLEMVQKVEQKVAKVTRESIELQSGIDRCQEAKAKLLKKIKVAEKKTSKDESLKAKFQKCAEDIVNFVKARMEADELSRAVQTLQCNTLKGMKDGSTDQHKRTNDYTCGEEPSIVPAFWRTVISQREASSQQSSSRNFGPDTNSAARRAERRKSRTGSCIWREMMQGQQTALPSINKKVKQKLDDAKAKASQKKGLRARRKGQEVTRQHSAPHLTTIIDEEDNDNKSKRTRKSSSSQRRGGVSRQQSAPDGLATTSTIRPTEESNGNSRRSKRSSKQRGGFVRGSSAPDLFSDNAEKELFFDWRSHAKRRDSGSNIMKKRNSLSSTKKESRRSRQRDSKTLLGKLHDSAPHLSLD